MERCPNCGAPARPNAKFCTTCGYRLPESRPVAVAAPESAVAPSIDEPQAADAAGDEPVAADLSAEPDDAQSVEAPPAWAPPTEARPAGATDGAAVADDAGLPAHADEVIASSWPASPPSWSDTWGVAAEEPAAPDGAIVEEESGDAVEAADLPAATLAAGSTGASRALALLDELRAIVPTLGQGDRVDAEAIAAELDAALEPTEAEDDLAALREALLRARDRPKDIDTVLDLAGRVDAAIALLDAHERLRAAAVRAAAELRGEGGR